LKEARARRDLIGGDWLPHETLPILRTLRAVLDYAGLTGEANPARDPRLRLPRQQHEIVEPSSALEADAIIANVPKRHRLPLRVLEQTGMRVGELHQLEWQDVDVAGLASASATARRRARGDGSPFRPG
jgi:integrase